jgi:hypothetical protein
MSNLAAPIAPPDPTRVASLIDALSGFIAASAWQPGQPSPPQDVARDSLDRLRRSMASLRDAKKWKDPKEKCTGAGIINSSIRGIRKILAGIRKRSSIYASPMEQRWLPGHLEELRRGVEAIERLGPFGSMSPMDVPGPVPRPDPQSLAEVIQYAGLWLRTARLHEGDEPRNEDRPRILNASINLKACLAHFKNDHRWSSIDLYRPLFNAVNDIALLLHEAMNRGHLVKAGDGFVYNPPESVYVNGLADFDPGYPFLDPPIAREAERAIRRMREELQPLREIEGESIESAEVRTAGSGPVPDPNAPIENPIPAEYRSRPMSKTEAAKLLGYGGKNRTPEKRLSSAMSDETILYHKLHREQFIFDVRQFPATSRPQMTPDPS